MDRENIYKKLSEMSLESPTDRNDILAKRFGAPMKKMTYRDTCIDYVKKTMPCVGYRNYVVAELQKLERIGQIVDDCDSGMISCEQLFLNLKTILEQE